MKISPGSVGRIAERIAMNELEARGFHIIDLAYMSKTSANVDFIASKSGKSFNVQVKGATNAPDLSSSRMEFQYGQANEDIVDRRRPLYNSKSEFALKADVVVLIAVCTPTKYRAIVMPVEVAETAAQINMDGYFRQPKLDGGERKAGRITLVLDPPAKPRKLDPLKDEERALLKPYEGAWESLGGCL